MAVTAQELNAAAQRLLSAYATVTPKIDEALSLIQRLDPCSAGAKAALDKSKVVRDQGASIFNGEVKEALRAYNALYAQAEGEVKELGQSLNQQINGTQDSIVAKNGIVKEFQASFAEKIAKCPAATPPATANNTPTTTTTATANAAPGAQTATTVKGDGDSDKSKDTSASDAAQSAAKASETGSQQEDTPGRRTYNPLAKYPTYTYNLSLYMCTPTAYTRFINSGRQKLDLGPNGGAVVICQTGGINSAVETRAAGFSLDYYIDNLRITSMISGKDNGTATNTTEIEFTVSEPYGFSFISNLKRSSDELIAKSKEEGLENIQSSLRQFFILGIRFTGFNSDGTPASSKEDPLFERFYDLSIVGMTFKLDNKVTTYNIKGVSMAPGTAFGLKRGVWDSGGTVKGLTVYDALSSMMAQLNKKAQDDVKGKNIKPNSFKFKFMGKGVGDDPASQKRAPIFSAALKSSTELNKAKLVGPAPPVPVDSGQPNEKIGEFSVGSSTPILQAFDQIISRSAYIEDAFKVIQTSQLEANKKQANGEIVKATDSQATVSWYNVSAEVSNAKYFKEIGDFTFDILYIFTVYETPIVINPYSNLGIKYYGPHKRYDYWFTGKNTEILNYSQTLDNTFFNVAVVPTASNAESAPEQTTPVKTGGPIGADNTGTQNEQQNMKKAYVSSLFDPGAYATATVRIMGDPDYLMPESTTSVNSLYKQFYGPDGFTISPNGGQVFIEIDFKEPQDYGFKSTDGITFNSTGDGLMGINESIQFWRLPPEIDKVVEGVSYQVLSVKSTFANGKFEQDLQLTVNQFPKTEEAIRNEAAAASAGTQAGGREGQAAGGQGQTGTAGTAGGTGTSTGLVKDNPPSTSQQGPSPVPSSTSSNGGQSQTTPKGVANDDSMLQEVKVTKPGLTVTPPNFIEPGPVNIAAPQFNFGRGGG